MKTSLLVFLLFVTAIFCYKAEAFDEDIEIKLNKRLLFSSYEEAKNSLLERTLTPPVKLGIKRDDVHSLLGQPKEVIGYGDEIYRKKESEISVHYTTDQQGDVINSLVEFRPKKPIPWPNWIKSSVQLPDFPTSDPKMKKYIVITLQIRINDIGSGRSMQITLIGGTENVNFANWSLIL
ncbi:MAG: hypothetical protein JNN15_14290 [Blastocatellia bacterium]|nr:hypothetical protein [Blastocatellia bacterium]